VVGQIIPPEAYDRWRANMVPDPRNLAGVVPIRADEDVADLNASEQAGERRRQYSRRKSRNK
jgi:hypothetical protein